MDSKVVSGIVAGLLVSDDINTKEAIAYMDVHNIGMWGYKWFHCRKCGTTLIMSYRLNKEFDVRNGGLKSIEISAEAHCPNSEHRDIFDDPKRIFKNSKWQDYYGGWFNRMFITI